MLTLLTATGCRPQAWALCERWMAAQDYAGPVRWLIVDDGAEAQPVTFARAGWALQIIRPQPFWQPGDNTQARNLLAGLDCVAADERLVIIEDDDHYAPSWLSKVDAMLQRAELVGETHARYYNVATRNGRQLHNSTHASLCATALRGKAIDALRRQCEPGCQYIDIELWSAHRDRHLFGGNRVTGIKGLPGRGGIGMGHGKNFRGAIDRNGGLLRQWIGQDAEAYL